MRAMLRLIAVVFTLAMATTAGRAEEESIPLDKLPKAVSEAVKKRFPKAELLEAAKETTKDGDKEKIEYEVTLKDNGTKIDVMVTPEGKITLIEKAIAAKDLPKAVTDAIDAKYPKATYKIVEEVIKVNGDKETLDFYEVLLETADKKKFEIKLTAEGKITETEDKTGKKD